MAIATPMYWFIMAPYKSPPCWEWLAIYFHYTVINHASSRLLWLVYANMAYHYISICEHTGSCEAYAKLHESSVSDDFPFE